jgi:glucose/arabinose dehydrogenase
MSMKSVVHMPVGMEKRFRGLRMGPGNALYATTDEGDVFKIMASNR